MPAAVSRKDSTRGWRRGVPAATAFLLLVGSGATRVGAQDSHYWSEQYGTSAALLGGAAIGTVEDLSAVYYNPGALALFPEAGFVLSARAYRRRSLVLDNPARDGVTLASSATSPVAGMLATPLRFAFLGRHSLVYSVLTRQQFDIGVADRGIDARDLSSAPDDDILAAAFAGSVNLRETWTGLTWAYPVSASLGVGVSSFLAVRSHSMDSEFLAQALVPSGDVATAVRLRRRSLTHYRLLTKVGLSYQREPLSLGLNVTTPGLGLGGDGSATYNESVTASGPAAELIDGPRLAADIQSGVPTLHRSGWIVGAGAGFDLLGGRLHTAVEWFQGSDAFVALDAADFVPQSGGAPVNNDVAVALRSVVNWGVGVERPFSFATFFLSLSSDNSAHEAAGPFESDAFLTSYDLLQASGGASFRLGRLDLMLGAGYRTGSNPFPALLPTSGPLTPIVSPDSRLRLSEWSAFLGLELLRGDAEG